MYCQDRYNSDDDMANLLSAFDDESEDEIVEFVQSPLRHSENNGGPEERRRRAVENGKFDDVDLSLNLPDDGQRYRVREEDEFSPSWLYSRTVCLFVSFIGLGIVIAILGPTLLDLKMQTCSASEDLPYLFTVRSIGYLLGSLLGGFLFDRFNSYLILSIACMIAGISVGVTSLGGTIYSLLFIMLLQGACLGSLETGANVLVVFLWKKKSAPYMQCLHFMFAVGTFIAPLISKPFLLDHGDYSLSSFHAVNSTSNSTSEDCKDLQEYLTIKWAYILAALPLIGSSLVFLMFSCIRMPSQMPTKPPEQREAVKTTGDKILTLLVMFSLGMLFFLYVGSEITYGGFVFTFAVKTELNFTKQEAANVTAGFWGGMAVFRFLSIFIARHVDSFKMILADLIGCVLSSIILMIWGTSSVTCVWLASILMGASMASLFPSAITWSERFIEITGKSISVLINFASFGEMVLPLVIGTILAKYGADSFVIALGISILLTFGAFWCTIVINKQRTYKRSNTIAAHFQRFRDEEIDDVSKMGSEEIARLLEHTDDLIKREMERESMI